MQVAGVEPSGARGGGRGAGVPPAGAARPAREPSHRGAPARALAPAAPRHAVSEYTLRPQTHTNIFIPLILNIIFF